MDDFARGLGFSSGQSPCFQHLLGQTNKDGNTYIGHDTNFGGYRLTVDGSDLAVSNSSRLEATGYVLNGEAIAWIRSYIPGLEEEQEGGSCHSREEDQEQEENTST